MIDPDRRIDQIGFNAPTTAQVNNRLPQRMPVPSGNDTCVWCGNFDNHRGFWQKARPRVDKRYRATHAADHCAKYFSCRAGVDRAGQPVFGVVLATDPLRDQKFCTQGKRGIKQTAPNTIAQDLHDCVNLESIAQCRRQGFVHVCDQGRGGAPCQIRNIDQRLRQGRRRIKCFHECACSAFYIQNQARDARSEFFGQNRCRDQIDAINCSCHVTNSIKPAVRRGQIGACPRDKASA